MAPFESGVSPIRRWSGDWHHGPVSSPFPRFGPSLGSSGEMRTGPYWTISLDEVQATGAYWVVTPAALVEELRAMGDFAVALLHPMVGGIPPQRRGSRCDCSTKRFALPWRNQGGQIAAGSDSLRPAVP
jgi:hypothetical protein